MKKIPALTLIFLLAVAVPLQAATLLVPSQYPTIQAAIDAANNGDTVIISPGVYREQGNWDIRFNGKAITVRSTEPNDPNIVANTVIDCNEIEIRDGWVFRFPHNGFLFTDDEDANSVLDGISIINAHSYYWGGGITCMSSAPTIKNCVIKNCTTDGRGGGGIYCESGHREGNWYNSYPKIINCAILYNTVASGPWGGGGIYCYYSEPVIVNCVISHNAVYNPASEEYGGGIYFSMGTPIITNCIISGNRADVGGGVYGDNSPITLANCVISGNYAKTMGGGIYANGPLRTAGCTIASNIADGTGGGIFLASPTSDSYLTNSILWGNKDSSGSGQSAQITLKGYDLRRPPDIAFNCIQDNAPNDGNIPFNSPGSGNIDTDPKFVRNPNDGGDGWGDDPMTPYPWPDPCAPPAPPIDEGANDDFGDLHLQKSSSCINAGLPNYTAYTNEADADNHPRVIGPRIDMGAYEYAKIITVTEPKGGEVWTDGSKHEINWKSYGVNGTVDISYSTDGGTDWQQIGNSDVNAGSYLWQLPKRIDSNQCLISVVPGAPDADTICVESGVFEINRFLCLPGRIPAQSSHVGPQTGCVKWQFATGGPVTAAITIHNDSVFAACEDGKLYVLNENRGTLEWTYDANSPLIASAISVFNGMVYLGDSGGKLHALNRQGELQWTFDTHSPIHSMPLVSQDGNIYLCSEDGTFYAFAHGGSELWCFDTTGLGQIAGPIFATPQIATDGTIYLGGLYDPNLYAINPVGGSVKWMRSLGSAGNGGIFAPPAIAEDGVLYQTLLYDSNLYAIEPEQGQILWSVNLADPCNPYSGGWSQPTVGPDGTIYVNVAGAYLDAVRPDGTIKWMKKIGDVGGFTLTVDKTGLIYAASDDKHIYTIDPGGKIISEFEGKGWLSWPVIAGGHTLMASDANGIIWAVSDRDCGGQTLALHRPGDLNADGIIDWFDLALFAADWLGHTDNNMDYLTGDINKDMYVDFADFAFIAERWLRQE